MVKTLRGMKIGILAADGAGQAELETAREAVRRAGAQTELLSLTTGQIQTHQNDLDATRTYTVDRAVAHATVDDYDALLLVRGMVNPEKLCSDDNKYPVEKAGVGRDAGTAHAHAHTQLPQRCLEATDARVCLGRQADLGAKQHNQPFSGQSRQVADVGHLDGWIGFDRSHHGGDTKVGCRRNQSRARDSKSQNLVATRRFSLTCRRHRVSGQ